MSEDANPLLPRKAQKSTPLIPGVGVGSLGFRDHGQSLEIGQAMKGDRLRKREEELPRLEDLHRQHRLFRKSIDRPLEYIRLLLQLRVLRIEIGGRRRRSGVAGGGLGAVNAEGAVGAG